MPDTAFQSITSRQSWYAAEKLDTYYAAEYDTAGQLIKATGARPFAGIVQYGCDAADQMVTVVKGSFPALGSEDIDAGDLLTVDSAAAGKFRVADTQGDVVYGVALTSATTGNLFTISLNDIAKTIPLQG